MIHIKPGDVIAFELNNKYYYCLILSNIIYFGGNLVYAFDFSSDRLVALSELLQEKSSGFNAIVDFIFAKKENRLQKIGTITNYQDYWKHKFFKLTSAIKEKATSWEIYDASLKPIKMVDKLSEEEKKYPDLSRIDDTILVNLINNKWRPETDPRI